MIRVLIVAVYASVRRGLHALLEDLAGCTVVAEVSGSAEMEPILPDLHPDMVLFDQNDADSARVLAATEEAGAALVTLVEDGDRFGVLMDGLVNHPLPGWACLLKDAEGPEILAAVQAAAAGLVVLDRRLVKRGALSGAAREETGPSLSAGAAGTAAEEPLTPREREVLQFMAMGLPNKLIAVRLGITLHTVKFHVASILSRLGASSRTEAVTLAARRGLISL